MNSSKERQPAKTMEIKSFGQVFDFDGFIVLVRCFVVSGDRRRFELVLTSGSRTAVVDVPEFEHVTMAERISQAVLHFADSIRLSMRR